MSECEFLGGCPFFNDKMKEQPGMTQILKKKYCTGEEKNNCARMMIRTALGKEKVPMDLYPNQIEKAKNILNQ
jgi:hypothetical protein